MHLLNPILEKLMPTQSNAEQLAERHLPGLKNADSNLKFQEGKNPEATIKQVVSDLSRHQKALLEAQNEKFDALIKKILKEHPPSRTWRDVSGKEAKAKIQK